MAEHPAPAAVEAPAERTPFRKQPVQQRSARRVTLMLDTTAALLDEVGYETLSTTLIAQRSGIAVGSLYQFFPDKHAVVRALTQRNLETFLHAVRQQLLHIDLAHWWDVVDSVLDVYLHMHRNVAGFARVHLGDVVDVHLLDEQRANNTVLADALAEMLDDQLGLATAQTRLPITVAVEAGDALLKLAFRHNPDGDHELVNETKHLIKGYLESRLGA